MFAVIRRHRLRALLAGRDGRLVFNELSQRLARPDSATLGEAHAFGQAALTRPAPECRFGHAEEGGRISGPKVNRQGGS